MSKAMALRFNKGKPPIHLVPPEAIIELAKLYAKGAEKYAPRNWELGMPWQQVYDSMMRHALAWMAGEDFDPENGIHHMTAVAWNALALVVFAKRGAGVDDRPVAIPVKQVKRRKRRLPRRVKRKG